MGFQELAMTALRASAIYLVLLVVVRLLGKRTVGNTTAFDLIVALILGEIVDEPIFGNVPMIQALLAIAVIGAWHFLNSFLSYRSKLIDEITGGKAQVMIREGEIDRRALARERVNEEELWSLLRQQQVEDLRQVKKATLETGGQLSVIKTEEARTLEKGDLIDLLNGRRRRQEA